MMVTAVGNSVNLYCKVVVW